MTNEYYNCQTTQPVMSVSHPMCHTISKAPTATAGSEQREEQGPRRERPQDRTHGRETTKASGTEQHCLLGNSMLRKHKHVKQNGTSTRCPAVKGAALINLHEKLFLF